jgi:hypothetical protein
MKMAAGYVGANAQIADGHVLARVGSANFDGWVCGHPTTLLVWPTGLIPSLS